MPSRKTTAPNRAPTSSPKDPAAQTPRSIQPRAAALENSIGYSLRRAQFSTYAGFTEAMDRFDVRPSQFAVLVLVRSNPGLSQSAICSALGIQKTNFVALLDKLEARGLTERRKIGSDRRSSALHLTREGEIFVAKMDAAHAAMEKQLARRLGSKSTRELLLALHSFTAKAHTPGQ